MVLGGGGQVIKLQAVAKCILLHVTPFLAIINIIFHQIFELWYNATRIENYNWDYVKLLSVWKETSEDLSHMPS
jgi:hypothetical protein